MASFPDFITTNHFTFKRLGTTVSLEPKDGVPPAATPACAVVVGNDDVLELYVASETTSSSGNAVCVKSDWSQFAQVLVNKRMTPRPQRWPFFFLHKKRSKKWEARYSNPIFFQIEGPCLRRWEDLGRSVRQLCAGHRLVIDSTVKQVFGYESRKGYGGGQNVLDVWDASFIVGLHNRCISNIEVPGLLFGDFQLWFFPNFLLIQISQGSFQLLTYSGLTVEVKEATLITNAHWPNGEVVGQTWTYVNKDGSPDRRYSNNPPLNIIRSWELDIISTTDRIDLQTTNQRGAEAVAAAIRAYA